MEEIVQPASVRLDLRDQAKPSRRRTRCRRGHDLTLHSAIIPPRSPLFEGNLNLLRVHDPEASYVVSENLVAKSPGREQSHELTGFSEVAAKDVGLQPLSLRFSARGG